ncbi:MAG: hypothetical protein DHS20C18_49820 [Saprospiraceae bacterium]|nr:MAG: hypothetical protein DHS20C18_49820 [Saprospiraceae bacterium]
MSKLKAVSELVWSLKGREKVYINQRINENANYYLLYEALIMANPKAEEMGIEDDEKLKEKLKLIKAPFKDVKNKTSLVDNLSKTIYKHLRAYRAKQHQYDQLKTAMIDYQIVNEKNLKYSKREKLKQARKLAEKTGDLLALMEINREDRYQLWSNPIEKTIELDDKLAQESDKLYKDLGEEVTAWNIYFELFSYQSQLRSLPNHFRHTSPKRSFEAAFPLFTKPQSMHGQKRYLMAKTMYYQLIEDFEQLRNTSQEVLEWWNQYEPYKAENPYAYARDVNNYVVASLKSGMYDGIEEQFSTLEKLSDRKTKHIKQFIFERSILMRFFYYLNRQFYTQGIIMIPRIEQGLKKYKIDTNTRMLLIYNTCLHLFLAEDYYACTQWAEKLHKEKTDIKINLKHACKLIRLLATFELEYGAYKRDAPVDLQKELNRTKKYFQEVSDSDYKTIGMAVYDNMKAYDNASSKKETHLINLQAFLQSLDSKATTGIREILMWLEKKLAPNGTW